MALEKARVQNWSSWISKLCDLSLLLQTKHGLLKGACVVGRRSVSSTDNLVSPASFTGDSVVYIISSNPIYIILGRADFLSTSKWKNSNIYTYTYATAQYIRGNLSVPPYL